MAERCHCGSERKHRDPGYAAGWYAGGYECLGCGRIVERCTCPVFCTACQKPLFHGEANPCCAPTAATEVPRG